MAPPSAKPERTDVVITHPNRDKAVVQTTRAAVVLLLLISVALVLIVTIGGWSLLEGDIPVDLAFVIVYLVLAFYAARWNRGVLPVASALAVLLAIFSAAAAPGWFNRDGFGYAHPTIGASTLGVITLLIVPVQIALIAFAARGFGQGWNVELERRTGQADSSSAGARAQPA